MLVPAFIFENLLLRSTANSKEAWDKNPWKQVGWRDLCILTLFVPSFLAYTLPLFLLSSLRDRMLGCRALWADPVQPLWCPFIYAMFQRKWFSLISNHCQQTAKPSKAIFNRVSLSTLHSRISHRLLEWKQSKCKQIMLLPEVCKSLCGKEYDIRACVIIHSFIKIKPFTTIPNMIFFPQVSPFIKQSLPVQLSNM